ncbi:MAG: type I secretion system permease/ATPase [Micropepsaceae bacterium]
MALQGILPQILRALRPYAVFSLAMNVLILTVPIYMWQVFSRVLSSGRAETLLLLTFIAAAALLTFALLDIVRQHLLNRVSSWFGETMFGTLVDRAVNVAGQGAHVGAQPVRDLQHVRSFLGSQGMTAFFDVPWAPFFVLILFLIHSALGWIALAGAFALALLAWASEVKTRDLIKSSGQLQNEMHARIEAATANPGALEAMGMTPNLVNGWQVLNAAVLAEQQAVGDRLGVYMGLTKLVRLLLQIVTMGAAAYLVIERDLTSGGMIAASILMSRALAPVEQAIGSWRAMVTARDALTRIDRLLAVTSERPAVTAAPAAGGRLSVREIVYAVRGKPRAVLDGINLSLRTGEVLAIVGPSASGKSTLCQLLVGALSPTGGAVAFGGVDIRQLDARQRRKFIGYLPQNIDLFAGTIRANIGRMDFGAPDEAVIRAARLAGIHEMIESLPDGYDTNIGPGGLRLSGGQRQRIGLARALYGSPRLIVLDEPNAALDEEGERALAQAIQAAQKGGAVVVIVIHNSPLIKLADTVAYLVEGRIAAFGSRERVLAEIMRGATADQDASTDSGRKYALITPAA